MRPSFKNLITKSARIGITAAVVAASSASLHAQSGPVLLLLDKDAVASGQAPNAFAPDQINVDIAAVGLRDLLPAFIARVGQRVTLPAGQTGTEGWFSFTAVPSNWASAPGADDGLQNFLVAGPGLGSPDPDGDRQSLLDHVVGVKPLHETDLQMLAGRQACAVVYANDVAYAPANSSLRGLNLGLVAFSVVATIDNGAGALPAVDVQVLDAGSVCSGAVSTFGDASGW